MSFTQPMDCPEMLVSRTHNAAVCEMNRGMAAVSEEMRVPVIDVIHPGAVVVSARIIGLPKLLRVSGYPFGCWSILRAVNALDLEDALRGAGWRFLLMEPLIKTSAWGFDPNMALVRALRKAVTMLERENLNALEIKTVRFRRFLGVCRVRLEAYARQVQLSGEYSYGGCAPVFRAAA